jgi:hypothetical protein
MATGEATLERLVEFAKYASVKFVMRDGDIPAVIMGEDDAGNMEPIIMRFEIGDLVSNKDAWACLARAKLLDMRATRYVFVATAWQVKYERDEEPEGVVPSRHPRREEIIHVIGVEPGRTELVWSAKITRDSKNCPTIAPWEQVGGGMVTGSFLDLLGSNSATSH